jgi:hypothetical protein
MNIIEVELGVMIEDLLKSQPLGKAVKHDGNIYPRPTNARFSPANPGVDDDATQKFFPAQCLFPLYVDHLRTTNSIASRRRFSSLSFGDSGGGDL